MTYVYLVRHGQAGTRENYDVLSDLGREQAKRLGGYFVEEGIRPEAIYSGSMRRQAETAEIAVGELSKWMAVKPSVAVDERWNEFSLISVYRAISQRLVEDSEEFARDYQEMQRALEVDPHTTRGATGRCDFAVIKAWIGNRYPDYAGEKWSEFRARIVDRIADLARHSSEHPIAVFTSATPIAILTAEALGLSENKFLSILGVIYNTSVSVIRVDNGALRAFTFNATPHLHQSMRTFR